MTEEEDKHKSPKQPSMKRRSNINDYRGKHLYMVTLAVEGRQALLGKVVGNPLAAEGSSDAPRIELSALGGAVYDCWQQIPKLHPEVKILALQIMPDHLHGILWVETEMQHHLGHIIGGFKTGCNKAYRWLCPAALPQSTLSKEHLQDSEEAQKQKALSQEKQATGKDRIESYNAQALCTERQPAPTVQGASSSAYAAVVPQQSKSRSRSEDRHHGLLFEPNYNDLICKDYEMLPTLIHYVKDNPRRLLMKRAHPNWLRPFFNLRLGSHTYSGIGNLDLLKAPMRKAVRISRRNNEAQLAEELHHYLSAAQAGAILISPAISPGEKRVMRAAFEAELPTIVIMENGFTPLSKPHGEQFYACAAGRLLMLSPWPHHNEHRPLTAQQCSAMNLMAQELAHL